MAVRKRSLNGKSMSEESKEALKNEKANEYLKSLLSQVTIDLPTIEDLEFLKSIECEKGYYTDLCKITSCNEDIKHYFLRDDDDKENIHYGPNNSTIDLVNKGKINNNKNSRRDFAIRPVLDFSNCPELFDIIIKHQRRKVNNDNVYGIVELGKYPQMVETWYSISSTIKAIRKSKKILSYTFDKVLPTYLSSDFKPLNITVYKNSEYYHHNHAYTIMEIRNLSSFYDKITHNLNEYSLGGELNKTTFKEGRMVSVEVDSIKWIVDSERKRLIAEECLVSGIQFMRYNHPNDKEDAVDYSKSNVRWYMEKYMKEQMFQYTKSKDLGVTDLLYDLALEEEMNKHEEELEQEAIKKKELEVEEVKEEKKEETKVEPKKEEVKEANLKKDEITALLESIRDYKEFYLGEDDINRKVKKIYNDYINNLNKLSEANLKKDNGLYLETRDPNFYYQRLVLDLTEILDQLKLHSTKVKDCFDMIEILEECRKTTIDTSKDPICEMINNINNTIMGFDTDTKTKNELIRSLDNILSNNIKRINSYVNEYKANINAKSRTIDELKEEFNKDFEPFKKRLDKVESGYKMINILKECKKDNVDPNMDDICQSVNNIKTVILEFIKDEKINNDLRRELEEILDSNINEIRTYIEENKDNDDTKVKTMDDLRRDFAADFTPFLQKLQRFVTTQDIVNDIIAETKEMIENHFIESKINIAKNYMDILNKTINAIKVNGTKADLELLRSKLQFEFDITKDISEILKKLEDYINDAYKIQLDIEERKNREKAIKEVRVDVDVDSILEGNPKTK